MFLVVQTSWFKPTAGTLIRRVPLWDSELIDGSVLNLNTRMSPSGTSHMRPYTVVSKQQAPNEKESMYFRPSYSGIRMFVHLHSCTFTAVYVRTYVRTYYELVHMNIIAVTSAADVARTAVLR